MTIQRRTFLQSVAALLGVASVAQAKLPVKELSSPAGGERCPMVSVDHELVKVEAFRPTGTEQFVLEVRRGDVLVSRHWLWPTSSDGCWSTYIGYVPKGERTIRQVTV